MQDTPGGVLALLQAAARPNRLSHLFRARGPRDPRWSPHAQSTRALCLVRACESAFVITALRLTTPGTEHNRGERRSRTDRRTTTESFEGGHMEVANIRTLSVIASVAQQKEGAI